LFNLISIDRHRLKTDGEGVTSLIGLAGCPLSCEYCINKEYLKTVKVKQITPYQLLERVMLDYCYYIGTGGGLTFGGGESLLHIDEIIEYMKINPEGISVNVETSMNVDISDEKLSVLMEGLKEAIIDIKTLDNELYMKYTGIDNKKVLKNLSKIVELGFQDKCKIRIPIIPKYKDINTAHEEAEKIKAMGYNNIDVFEYRIFDK